MFGSVVVPAVSLFVFGNVLFLNIFGTLIMSFFCVVFPLLILIVYSIMAANIRTMCGDLWHNVRAMCAAYCAQRT